MGIFIVSLGTAGFLSRSNQSLYRLFGSSEIQRKGTTIFVIFFGLLLFGAGMLNYFNFAKLRRAAREGKYEVVEGEVREFVPMPYTGHANESFVVKGHRFSYSDYDLTKGFNQTQSHGGPIRDGSSPEEWTLC